MKKLSFVLLSFLVLFSIFTVFSKPNPNSTSTAKRLKAQVVKPIEIEAEATPENVKLRLAELSSEIEFTYDATVQSEIDKYLRHGRKELAELVARSRYYLPIFEKALEEAGLPDQLKYVPILESQLKTGVTSPRGAGGLWQFMPVTAKGFDMKITSAIDERCDPYIASNRACRLLKYLYDRFGDWGLALAAYNAGEGNVMRAIRKAGGKGQNPSFQSVARFLPAQTRKYLPKLAAMSYLVNYYSRHDIKVAEAAMLQPSDTVHVREQMSLSRIAGKIGVSAAQLRNLNPHFRSDIVPANQSRPVNLILPAEKIADFKQNFSI